MQKPTKEEIVTMMDNEGIDTDMLDACIAYIDAFGIVDLSGFKESYQGEYKNDETFVRELLENTEECLKDLPVYIYIDWGRTTQDIMMDYTEESGYYFWNL